RRWRKFNIPPARSHAQRKRSRRSCRAPRCQPRASATSLHAAPDVASERVIVMEYPNFLNFAGRGPGQMCRAAVQPEFNAKAQRRKDAVETAKPESERLTACAHEKLMPKAEHKVLQNPCVLAPLRLCVKSLLPSYGS